MFCFKCGKNLPDNALFCNYCGAKISTKPAETPPVEQNETAENKNAVAPNKSVEKMHGVQPQNTYDPVNAAVQQSVQQPYSTPAEGNSQKKNMGLPITIGASALFIVAAIILLIIFIANNDKSSNDNAANSPSTSDITTTAPSKEETTNTDISDDADAPDDGMELIDNVPAANGHYTTKDLAGYIGWTGDEITNAFGYIMPNLVSQVNLYYTYDNISFTLIDEDGVSEVSADADIVEFRGETLNKTYDELTNLLGVPVYESISYEGGQISGRMGYLMNQNLYVSIRFEEDGNKASSVYVSVYSDKLPFELDYIKELFDSNVNFEDLFGSPRSLRFDSSISSTVLTYNAFTVYVGSSTGSLNLMSILPFSVTVDGESLDKLPSEIKSLLGVPSDEGDYNENGYQYYMRYILDDKLEIIILADDTNSKAKDIVITPYQEETLGDENDKFTTRDAYGSTLTLDSYGGFVLSVNRMSYFQDFSGSYYKTKDGYRFEVSVGRSELQEFEMRWQGDALIYYGESVGATFDGVTAYYPVRTINELKYYGDSVLDYLWTYEPYPGESVLYGSFSPSQMTIDGKKLNLTMDEITSLFGTPYELYYSDNVGAYLMKYWLEQRGAYKTFEVTFFFVDYDGITSVMEIEELIYW